MNRWILGLCAFLLLSPMAHAQEKLKPFQEKALQEMTAAFPENIQADMQQRLRPMISSLDEKKTESMMAAFRQSMTKVNAKRAIPKAAPAATTPLTTPPKAAASKTQTAAAMKQLEPVLRTLWNTNVEFDRVLKSKERSVRMAIARQKYETYGNKSSGNKIAFRIINGEPAESYAEIRQAVESRIPAKETYKFDFSSVSSTFDKKKVEQQIDAAYEQFHGLANQLDAQMTAHQKAMVGKSSSDRQKALTELLNRYQTQADQISETLGRNLSGLRPSITRQMEDVFQRLK